MGNTTLAPIRKTEHSYRMIRRGAAVTRYAECWAAETLDGVWHFRRFEESGTPWGIYHEPSVKDESFPLPIALVGTLRSCRKAVASGIAERILAQRKAEAA